MSKDFSNLKSLIGQFLPQRFLTSRILRFLFDEGIFEILASRGQFVLEEIINIFQESLGYKLQDRTRLRMAKVLIDLLHECEYLKNDNGLLVWSGGSKDFAELQEAETENLKEVFKGQLNFFNECMMYAGKFLRGAPPLYDFNSSPRYIWEEFLGNLEFRFARSVLIKSLLLGKGSDCRVLDLCYGPGFDILQIKEESPDIKVTALDFSDMFFKQVSHKPLNLHSVELIDSKLWKGFGTSLPFDDRSFDMVFFACTDPYISADLREYVYRDIFRTLRHGGSLGILTNSYPDPGRTYVKNTWIRRGVLCHDFLESVCEGWHGFSDADESVRLFGEIGYNISSIALNASLWKLDKL